jgi:dolichyl-phosphate beta-glucosyltransferase
MVAPVASRSTNDKGDLVGSVLVESAEPMNKGLVSRRNSTRAIIAADDEARTVHKPHWVERTKFVEPSRPDLSVIIPAYNEERRLGETLPVVWAYLHDHFPGFELIVVDDGSRDATAGVVESFARDHPGVQLISYPENRGKGHAVRTGILKAEGALILFSDADLSTPIGEVESLLVRLDAGSDVAIGSRAVPGSDLKVRQPWYREFAGRSFNRLARRLATPGLRDTQCGFKLFHRRAARDVFGRMVEDGFSFDIEALHLAIRLGYEIAEVPVQWTHQEGSKVRLLRDSARMFLALIRVRRRHQSLRAPARETSLDGVNQGR